MYYYFIEKEITFTKFVFTCPGLNEELTWEGQRQTNNMI
jgi:hypothetical protein